MLCFSCSRDFAVDPSLSLMSLQVKEEAPESSPKKARNRGAFSIFNESDADHADELSSVDCQPFLSTKAFSLALDCDAIMDNVYEIWSSALPNAFAYRAPAQIGIQKGFTEPWTMSKAVTTLDDPDVAKYLSAVNGVWFKHKGLSRRNKMTCWRNVLSASDFWFPFPCGLPDGTVILASVKDTNTFDKKYPEDNSLETHGNVEMLCAYQVALAIAVKAGTLTEWLPHLLKTPCMVHKEGDGKNNAILLKVGEAARVGKVHELCKMTAIQESIEWHDFEHQVVLSGIKDTQTALSQHVEKLDPNSRWISASVVNRLRSTYKLFVANVEAFELVKELQLMYGSHCLVNSVWDLNEFRGLTDKEIVYALQLIKVYSKRGRIPDPTKISKATLKGRSDRSDIGLLLLSQIHNKIHDFMEFEFGAHVRPEIKAKCQNPNSFDKASPCDAEQTRLKVDLAWKAPDALKGRVEKTYVDWSGELHIGVLDGHIREAFRLHRNWLHETKTFLSKYGALKTFLEEFESAFRQDLIDSAGANKLQLSDNDKGDALKNAEIIGDADDDLAAGVLAETQHCLLLQTMNDTATQNLKKTNEFVVLDPMLSADEVFARLRGVDAIRCFVGKWGEHMRHWYLDDCGLPEQQVMPFVREPVFGVNGRNLMGGACRMLGEGDLFFIFASCKTNARAIEDHFGTLKKTFPELSMKPGNLDFDENNCRRAKARGAMGASNIGWWYVITMKFPLTALKKKQRTDGRSTHSSGYGDLGWEHVSSLPKIDPEDKKKLYAFNSKHTVDLTTIDANLNPKQKKKLGLFDGRLAPFWMQHESVFIGELAKHFDAKCAVALTPMSGYVGVAGLKAGNMKTQIPVVHCVWNDLHRTLVSAELTSTALQLMCGEGDAKDSVFVDDTLKVDIFKHHPELFQKPSPPAEDADVESFSEGE